MLTRAAAQAFTTAATSGWRRANTARPVRARGGASPVPGGEVAFVRTLGAPTIWRSWSSNSLWVVMIWRFRYSGCFWRCAGAGAHAGQSRAAGLRPRPPGNPLPGPDSWWMAVVEKACSGPRDSSRCCSRGLVGLCLYLLLRYLWSRTPGRPGHRQAASPFAWLRRLELFLAGLRARLAGLRCARDGYRALLSWARRSGLRPDMAHTPAEVGADSSTVPAPPAEIGSIVEAFNQEVYREAACPPSEWPRSEPPGGGSAAPPMAGETQDPVAGRLTRPVGRTTRKSPATLPQR